MNIALSPGYNTRETIEAPMPRMARAFIDFMSFWLYNGIYSGNNHVLDIGRNNYKSECLREFGMNVAQIYVDDFNSQKFQAPQYDIITCFETLEHIQNPLFFMENIKSCMSDKGVLFLSTPGRWKFLWSTHHFHEMNEKHLTKWILKPLGLKIRRSAYVRISDGHPFWFYFTGFRPFLRLFFNYTKIYEIVKT